MNTSPIFRSAALAFLIALHGHAWSQACVDVDVEFLWPEEESSYSILPGCNEVAFGLSATVVPVGGDVLMEVTYSAASLGQIEQAVFQLTTLEGCFAFFHPNVGEEEMLAWSGCNGCQNHTFDILAEEGSQGMLAIHLGLELTQTDFQTGEWSIQLGAFQQEMLWTSLEINLIEAGCGGCTYPSACNFVSSDLLDDGSCDFVSCLGCMQVGACNYDSTATVDDGSCTMPPCNFPGNGPSLDLIPVNNPFYNLSYVAENRTPFLSSYSGWFDDGDVEVSVFNPLSSVSHVELVVYGDGISVEQAVPVLPTMGLVSGIEVALPDGMSAHDVLYVQLRLSNSVEVVDELGSLDEPLSELNLAGIPRAAGQHNLIRKAWVLKGSPMDEAENTWKVVEENEGVSFSTSWNLDETVNVAYYVDSEDCLDDNGNGLCDQLELPVLCENVNATNYSPSELVLLCNEAETLEFWESSCCNGSADQPPLEGLPPPEGNGNLPLFDAPCGSSAAKLSFCNAGQRAFVLDQANRRIRILDYGDLNQPSPEIGGAYLQIDAPNSDMVPAGLDVWNVILPDSIICCSTMVAVAWVDTTQLNHPGYIGFYGTSGELLDTELGIVEAGFGTRGLAFSPDGKWLVAANSGERDSGSNDPMASLTCVDVSSFTQSETSGSLSGLEVYQVSLESVAAIGGGEARMAYSDPQATLAQILEPNAVSFTPDSKRAWVTCTVNNATIELDMEALEGGGSAVLGAFGLGTRDMTSGRGFDGKSNGTSLVEMPSFGCKGWRQPREVTVVQAGAMVLMLSANEGRPRLSVNGEEEVLSFESAGAPDYTGLQIDPAYGFGATGDELDDVYVYGSRSFSIWDVTWPGTGPQLIYDSESLLEETLASLLPTYANSLSSANGTHDQASVARGPEPSSVKFGMIQGKEHLFVSLEQMGGAMVFSMSNWGLPSMAASFQGYASNRNFADEQSDVCALGDLGATDVLFLPQAISNHTELSGVAENMDAILVANDVSGTVSVFSLSPTHGVPGCINSCACNYSPSATFDNGSCDFSSCVLEGCTYPDAANFAAEATVDNGSCIFEETCAADLNGSGLVDSADLLELLTKFGFDCP